MKIKTMSRGEILQKMTDTVEAVCEAYKSDFYEYDVQTISEMKPYEERMWLVRDTGTWFPADPEFVESVLTCSHYEKAVRIQRSASGEWFEYEPLKQDEVKRWIKDREENYELRLYDELLSGTIFCTPDHNGRMVPRLDADDGEIYYRPEFMPADAPMESAPMDLRSLKHLIDEEMKASPCYILESYEKASVDQILKSYWS